MFIIFLSQMEEFIKFALDIEYGSEYPIDVNNVRESVRDIVKTLCETKQIQFQPAKYIKNLMIILKEHTSKFH